MFSPDLSDKYKEPKWIFVLDTESRQLLKNENPLILDFGDRQKTLVESYDQWIEYKFNNKNNAENY